MPKKICRFSLFLAFLFTLTLSLRASLKGGIDRAKAHENHLDVVDDFMEDTFMTGDKFDEKKILDFIYSLERDREKLKQDLIETEILEDVELYVKKPNKTKKKKSKTKKVNEDPLVIGYTEYLIPKLRELLEAVKQEASREQCEALVSDFIRGYVAHYIPNFKRTAFPFDTDVLRSIKHFLKSYAFDRRDKKVEAINLLPEASDVPKVKACLGEEITTKTYLTEDQIQKLKVCGFDISRLNPGISPLWTKPNEEERRKLLEGYKSLYPTKEEKVYIKKIIYRGMGSPKVTALFVRDGKEIELKLKLGSEARTELVTSSLFRKIGFNHDFMRYEKVRKIYLRETTYQEMLSQFANKNGVQYVNWFIWGHGKDENGEEWILLKDFLFECRPEDELRAANLNFSSWDLQDRREFRALMLTWGWLGMNDTKFENFKLIYKRTKEGNLVPYYRFQDTGIGLGAQALLRHPKDLFEMLQYYKVNTFPKSFVKWGEDKNIVKIVWNDFALAPRMFKRTTWYDLKWAARLICQLSPKTIYNSLYKSGMPDPVAKMYYYKFLSRRNDFIDAFELSDEFTKDEIPNFKDINETDEEGKPTIKNGEVVQTSFEGKNDVVQMIDKWSTFFLNILSKIEKTADFWSENGGYRNRGVGINYSPTSIAIPLGLGFEALLSRHVERTKQPINVAGKTHQYAIIDTLRIRVGADSMIFNYLIAAVKGLSVNFGLSFFEREYSHIHFEDEEKKAFRSKFNLFHAVGHPKEFAAKHLEPMDIFKTHMNYGVDASASVSYNPFFALTIGSTGIGFRVKKFLTNHYARDQYGQLRVLKEKSVREDFAINLKAFEINTYEAKLPFLGIGLGAGKFKMNFNSYFIPRGETVRDGVESYLTDELKNRQAEELKRGVEKSDAFVNDYTLETRGSYSNFSLGALFLFNRDRSRSSALTKVKQGDDVRKTFYRYALFKENSFGVPNLTIDYGTTEILTRNRKTAEIIAEAEFTDSEKIIYAIRVEDYYRVRTREKTEALIRDLNRRYSESEGLPFYRDYEIPERMDSNRFRQIYAKTRVLVSGKELESSFMSLREDEVCDLLAKHFNTAPDTSRFRVRLQKHHIVKLYKKIRKRTGQTIEDKTKKIKYFSKILSHLRVETFGVKFLRSILKKKSLFVMGDISGIFRNYSTMQSLQQQQKRRFSGVSWGKLSKKPPLQKFMRNQRYVYVSNHIQKDLKDQEYLGRLEIGVPRNIDVVFNLQGDF